MKRQPLLFKLLILVTIFGLAACSTAQASPTAQPTTAAAQSNAGSNSPRGGNGAISTEEKLSVGILKLEGTSLAVTADQAKLLLPLWQQVQTLSADSNTTPAQLQAVFTQIQSTLNADQTKSIDAMNLTFQDIQGLMTQLGIQAPNGAGFNGQGGGTLTPDQQATRQAGIATRQAGLPPVSGTPQPGVQGTPNPQRTPGAGFGSRGGAGGRGIASMFVEPVIQLLQQRAGA